MVQAIEGEIASSGPSPDDVSDSLFSHLVSIIGVHSSHFAELVQVDGGTPQTFVSDEPIDSPNPWQYGTAGSSDSHYPLPAHDTEETQDKTMGDWESEEVRTGYFIIGHSSNTSDQWHILLEELEAANREPFPSVLDVPSWEVDLPSVSKTLGDMLDVVCNSMALS